MLVLDMSDDIFEIMSRTETMSYLAESAQDLLQRGINVQQPPAPLMPLKGDGSDESANIQAILDYAKPYQTVYFPTPVSNYYSSQNLRLKTGSVIKGDNPTMIQFAAGKGFINGSFPARITGIRLEGLRLQGASTASGIGLELKNIAYSTFENLDIRGFNIGIDFNAYNDACAYNLLYNVTTASNDIGVRYWDSSDQAAYTSTGITWCNFNSWQGGRISANRINIQSISGEKNIIKEVSLEQATERTAYIGAGIGTFFCYSFTLENCWIEPVGAIYIGNVYVYGNAYNTVFKNVRPNIKNFLSYTAPFPFIDWVLDQGLHTQIEMPGFSTNMLNHDNMISNGGFEEWADAATPKAWTKYGTPTISREYDTVFSGENSIKLVGGAGTYQGVQQDIKLVDSDIYQREGILISFRYFAPNTNTDKGQVRFYFNGLGYTYYMGDTAANKGQWITTTVLFRPRRPKTWKPNTVYAVNDLVFPSTRNGKVYRCSTAGTSGATEPTWSTTTPNTNTDGTAVFTCTDHTIHIEIWASYNATASNTVYVDGMVITPLTKILHAQPKKLNESESTVLGNLRIDKNGNLVLIASDGSQWKVNVSTGGVLSTTSFTG